MPPSRARSGGGGRSGGVGAAARGAADRSLLLEARLLAPWHRRGAAESCENVESDDDPCDLKLSATFVITYNIMLFVRYYLFALCLYGVGFFGVIGTASAFFSNRLFEGSHRLHFYSFFVPNLAI